MYVSLGNKGEGKTSACCIYCASISCGPPAGPWMQVPHSRGITDGREGPGAGEEGPLEAVHLGATNGLHLRVGTKGGKLGSFRANIFPLLHIEFSSFANHNVTIGKCKEPQCKHIYPSISPNCLYLHSIIGVHVRQLFS